MKSLSSQAGLELLAVCLMAVVFTSACENASSDSAGPAIVSSGQLEGIPNKRLSGPILEVKGSSDFSDASFSSVRTALRLEDGRIVIADGGSRTLKLFDNDGSFVRRLGSASSEALAIRAIWPAETDTVVVYDERRQLVLEVPLDGSKARTWKIESARLNARAVGRLSTGQVILRTLAFDPPDSGFDTTMVSITMHTEGVGVDTVGSWPSSRMGRVGEPPLQLVTAALFEPRLAASAAADRLVIAECRTPEFRSIKPYSNAEVLVRWPAEVAEVTTVEMQRYLQALFEGVSGEERQRLGRMVESTPVSATLPVCDQVQVDISGRTWVRSFLGPGATQQQWLVFDQQGEPLFTAEFPVTTVVVDFGLQHVTAVERDPSGQQRVLVYGLD